MPSLATHPSSRSATVEEVRRVLRIARAGREAREGPEDRRRPLPAIAHQILDAPRRRAARVRPDRLRLPAVEIEDAGPAPSVPRRPTDTRGAPDRRRTRRADTPLQWAGDAHASARMRWLPPGSHTPATRRQRQTFEHAAVVPPLAVTLPEGRMLDAVLAQPVPIGLAPEPRLRIAACCNELAELFVGHVRESIANRPPRRRGRRIRCPSQTGCRRARRRGGPRRPESRSLVRYRVALSVMTA